VTREVGFTEKDAPLRDDVRTLGALVGSVIREQGGDALFERVEAARVAAIRRRESGDSAEADLHAIVSGLAPRDAADLVQGFLAYFEVVNLAERVHRIRRRRDHLRESAGAAGAPPQEEGLEDAWRRLAARGLGPSEIARLLGRLRFEPVFTAHPTEATRRTLLEKQQTIGRLLVRRLDPSRTPDEERATLGRIRDEITIAWQTEAQRAERPTVLDELHHVLFFLTDVVYRVVPAFYEEVEETLAGVFGPVVAGIPVPPVLRFASWVGGDMDGNPNAGADTIRAALARHRALVLERYQREALELSNRLTQSATRISVDDAVVRRAADYAASFPEAFEAIPPRYRTMPYRLLLRLVAARLAATGRDDPHGYPSAAEFAADMETVRGSLARHGGAHAGLFSVRRLLRRVETFGFHLAALDARQDAFTHRAVMGRLLGDAGWLERSSAERAARLSRALSARDPLPPMNDPAAERTVAVFRALAEGRARYGADALGPYVVSMAQGEDDVLTVLLLAQWSGLGAADSIPLDVAPLFETDADLAAAPRVLAALLADPWYRRHVERRGHQIVMIGYSDSNKEIGIAASRWALQRAQVAIAAALDPTGIDLTIFHGRGGSVSRGGGKVAGGVLAAPPGTVRGRLRVTVQGEAITASYGLRGIALRTLEQAVSAVALATALPPPADDRTPRWHTLMDEIAAASHAAYRALVYDDPRFVEYFRLATPIDVIERMPIGSRPPARTPGTGLAQLRAIPWVFAWTQSRHVLPGWYGVGTALEGAVRRHGEATVAEMIRDWAFMKTLVDDVEMVLAKADIGIAARYAHLAGALEGSYFPGIRAEFERTVSWVLRLKGTSALLDEDPALQRSIRLRNPYVDPMSLLQVELLVRWRAAGRPDDDLLQALLATVRGIAQGLQNTG
jgi:phosphoenolpyruvate carboxylase